MKKKQVNAMEVARKAGVSQSTVSRVFTLGSGVSEKAKRRVMEAGKRTRLSPKRVSRGLITNKTNMIGLAMRDIQNPYYPEVLGKFTKWVLKMDYSEKSSNKNDHFSWCCCFIRDHFIFLVCFRQWEN